MPPSQTGGQSVCRSNVCCELWSRLMPLLSNDCLNSSVTQVTSSPFAFLVAREQLSRVDADALELDFPRYREDGFFPHDPNDCGPSVNALVNELTAPKFAESLGQKLGVPDLARYPTLVTLSRSLNKTHGTIH